MDTGVTEQLETFRQQWKKELSKRSKSETNHSNSPSQPSVIKKDKTTLVASTEKQSVFHDSNMCTDNEDLLAACLKSVKTSPTVRQHLLNSSSAQDAGADKQTLPLLKDSLWQTRSSKGHSDTEYTKHKLKRLKHQKLEDIFLERQPGSIPAERLLDRLISDIDEITEIPFFDISLPKEVAVNIFQFLNMQDLCHCAQVSKSWNRLAEDELLWCKICHQLGYEKIYTTHEKTNWKSIVQHNVKREQTLIFNWKNFNGKLSSLEHVKGKKLTAVHSCRDTVVAGYTNGDVKLWDLSTEETVLYQPSSTSLLIREENETESGSVQTNMVHSVQTAGSVTAAVYTHGNIDIWDMQSGSQILQTHFPKTGYRFTPKICLAPSSNTIVAGYANYIDILHRDGTQTEFNTLHQLDTERDVNHLKLVTNNCDTTTGIPHVVFSKAYTVSIYTLLARGSGFVGQESEVHNIFGASIEQVDTKRSQSWLGVALGMGTWGGFTDKLQVKLYDLPSGKLLHSLGGHSWLITCMNISHSPQNELVTGSADRNVRVYDVRVPEPVVMSYFVRAVVTCVQMDDWKVVSGSEDGFVQVWDRRMKSKLWEYNNRHPVRYLHFKDRSLIVGNVSSDLTPQSDELEMATHRRYRGSVSVYDFLSDMSSREMPEISLSTYDQPEASRYNIGLTVPYDTLQF